MNQHVFVYLFAILNFLNQCNNKGFFFKFGSSADGVSGLPTSPPQSGTVVAGRRENSPVGPPPPPPPQPLGREPLQQAHPAPPPGLGLARLPPGGVPVRQQLQRHLRVPAVAAVPKQLPAVPVSPHAAQGRLPGSRSRVSALLLPILLLLFLLSRQDGREGLSEIPAPT